MLAFTVDRKLRIRSWNEDLKMLTGADAADATGKKYTDLFPRILAHDKEAVAQAFSGQRALNLKQCRFGCLSGHRQADIRITPIRKGTEPVREVQIELVPSDPCQIGQQLIDSQKLIAIGKIAATLAHGVRNPLNAIKGAIVYLRDQYAYETQLVEFTNILEAEMSRLENFISRFLSTATFDSDIAVVDVNELIRKIKVLISLQTHTQAIRCDYHLADVPGIEISAFHLEQALLNVINNSLEAMKSGGTLTIRTSLRPGPPQTFIAIEISDTGKGMDIPAASPVADRKVRRPGRGFGLFIADEIVKYYKGHLKLHGEKGKGTTVSLLLPTQHEKDGAHL